MTEIRRFEATQRLSRAVVHGSTVYLAGVTSTVRDDDIAAQTQSVLDTIEQRLAAAGSGKGKLLSAQIWLKDMDAHFAGMNAVWEAWVPQGQSPARATCEARMSAPDLLVEIIVTAAL